MDLRVGVFARVRAHLEEAPRHIIQESTYEGVLVPGRLVDPGLMLEDGEGGVGVPRSHLYLGVREWVRDVVVCAEADELVHPTRHDLSVAVLAFAVAADEEHVTLPRPLGDPPHGPQENVAVVASLATINGCRRPSIGDLLQPLVRFGVTGPQGLGRVLACERVSGTIVAPSLPHIDNRISDGRVACDTHV